jgi:hypothetical protein
MKSLIKGYGREKKVGIHCSSKLLLAIAGQCTSVNRQFIHTYIYSFFHTDAVV